MKFEYRILKKIIFAFLLAWLIFIVFLYYNLKTSLVSEFQQGNEESKKQLATIINDTGNSLLSMSKNISTFVFRDKSSRTYSFAEVKDRLDESWEMFGSGFPLLSMNHYNKDLMLTGSWGVAVTRNQVYATSAKLLRAFQERAGINYFSCDELCYFHATRALYPDSFEYGIIHLSIPVDNIFYNFRALGKKNISSFVLAGDPAQNGVAMLGNHYTHQTTSSLLEYRRITPYLEHLQEQQKAYFFADDKGDYGLYAFSLPDEPTLLYVLSEDVSDRISTLWTTFNTLALTSFLILSMVLVVLHFSLHAIISRLNQIIEILPLIGQGRFEEAAKQLILIASNIRQYEPDDELSLLHTTTETLNRQLQTLHGDFVKQNIQLRQLADYDAMTGLYNRRKFQEVMAKIYEAQVPFYLVNFDLDQFKFVNDTLGHAVGDKLLLMFSAVLKQHAQEAVIGRIGGDEFTMILVSNSREEVKERLDKITSQIAGLEMEGSASFLFRCRASVGLAHYPDDSKALKELIMFADAAMYQNKKFKQEAYTFYSGQESLLAEEKNFSKWVNLIYAALQSNSIYPSFQPIVEAADYRVFAYEALARIDSSYYTMYDADDFIHYAEKSQLIARIDYVMIDRILSLASRSADPPRLMINISGVTLAKSDIGDYIREKLHEYSYNPELIVFEITESHEITNFEKLKSLMTMLRAMGIRFAIDDFGMGYSSFSYISLIRFDFIKIDKSIVRGLLLPGNTEQVSSQHILESIIHIAKQSNITTIMEGVESVDILEALLKYNLNLLQGYYFGKPNRILPASI